MASSKHTCQRETGPGDGAVGCDGEPIVARLLQLHQQRDRLSADLTLSDNRKRSLAGEIF